ncbi:MAG: hypothetical protein ACXWHF_06055, partial [Chthoniobacterales bacterium]
SIVTKEVLEQRKDRNKFRAAVYQIFEREEFPTLEVLAEELRQSRERNVDGEWLLDDFFEAFHVTVNAPDARYAHAQEKIAKWRGVQSGSNVLPLVEARFHIDSAAHAVGAVYTRSINRETRREYRTEMAAARQILENNPAAKMYPEYFELMERVAVCQRWRKDDFFRVFDEATRTFSDYEEFYRRAAEFLLPRWMGKKGEWEQFAQAQRRSHGEGGVGDALYGQIVWSMHHYYKNVFRETAISWENTASGFEYLMRQYPESKLLKNAYGNLAWRAGDRGRLRQALAEIGANPDMGVWVNLENVALAERMANETTTR